MDSKRIRLLLIWIVLFAIALALDAHVATFMHQHRVDAFLQSHHPLREVLKAPGFFPFTLIIVIPLVIWRHRADWLAGGFVLAGTILSGSNQLFKWFAGRTRPYRPMDGSDRLAPFELHPFLPLNTKNLSFPSGHAALAFATAATLAILWPRFRWAFYALATLVAMERIAENAHWLSDTVAAAVLGIGGAHLIRWIWWSKREQMEQRGFPVKLIDA